MYQSPAQALPSGTSSDNDELSRSQNERSVAELLRPVVWRRQPLEQVITDRLRGHQSQLAIAVELDELLVHGLDQLSNRNLDCSHVHACIKRRASPRLDHFDHMHTGWLGA